jgi:uncharacterized protein
MAGLKQSSPTRLIADIDLEGPGKRQGYIRLPQSTHESAYGFIPIPLVVIAGEAGPTTLLTAGNHGDEYEGEVALANLSRSLSAGDLTGRLIILPALNLPAALAGRRVSPIDSGNLNRAFPGDFAGSATAQIAYYVEQMLMPLADAVCDLHSGGSSLHYVPSVVIPRWSNTERFDRSLALVQAFGAPYAYILSEPAAEDPTLLGAAGRQGKLFLGTELGGSGALTPANLKIAEQGLRGLLAHLGHLPPSQKQGAKTKIFQVGGADYFVHADDEGVFEPLVDIGNEVADGQPAALIHFPEKPWLEPVACRFGRGGTVLCIRVPARVKRGDCLFHVGTPEPVRP